MAKKTKKIKGFWKFFIIYCVALVVIISGALLFLHGLLKDYESSMPNNTMQNVVDELSGNEAAELLNQSTITISEFETNDSIINFFKNQVNGETIFYKRKNGEFTNSTPVYLITAGDRSLAKVTLVPKGRNRHNFTEWQLGTISFDEVGTEDNKTVITVPAEATVKVNNIEVSDTYITNDKVIEARVKHVDKFVAVPYEKEYTIEGLIAVPEVSVSLNETDLTVTNEGNDFKAEFPVDDSMLEEQKTLISNINQAYGKYIINKGSLSTLKSYLVGNAREYVSDIPAVWAFLYQKEYTYEFKNESITNLVKYSEDCFSCDVYYDLYVQWNNGNKTYNTSMEYTFVKTEGKWKLADFSIK